MTKVISVHLLPDDTSTQKFHRKEKKIQENHFGRQEIGLYEGN